MNNARPRLPIVILISGRGSNMRTLIEHSLHDAEPYSVARVLSDKPDAAGLDVARDLDVSAAAVPAGTMDRASYDAVLAAEIRGCSPSLIVLAGFMRILSAPFVAEFCGRILNIHPSLLPKYPGLHTHRRALEARETQHGATVHFVTEQLDRGPRVIQGRVAVAADEDEASLAARVQLLEHRIYPFAVRWFCQGRLRYDAGRVWLDGRLLEEPVQFTGNET